MDKPKRAEVVTIKEAVKKVENWIVEKDFEKAKQGCKEILAVEKNNTEIQTLLNQANQGLEENSKNLPNSTTDKIKEVIPKEETPLSPPPVEPIGSAKTPDMIMNTNNKKEAVIESPSTPKKEVETTVKKSFHTGRIILIILLLAIIGALIFTFIRGWFDPVFDWILNLLGL